MTQLSTKLPWDLAQTKWASQINPILALPMNNGVAIIGIKLAATTPLAVNHLLQRLPQGWFLIDIQANAIIWRVKPFNDLTLMLESSADTTISIWVF